FDTGEVYIFRIKNDNLVEVAAKLDNYNNLPALSMGVIEVDSKNILAIAFLNGEVKLHNFNNDSFELITTIGAHLRIITHLITYKNAFVTCGDDCFINVWKVDNDYNIKIAGNYDLKDKMVV